MIIKPRVRGFLCTTTHPTGCAANVKDQINYIKHAFSAADKNQTSLPKKVLVIGSSTGYGLAARITAAFGYQANTLGLFFERPSSDSKTGSAGWYNSAAFHQQAHADGLYAKSINGDAFSNDIKQVTIDTIKEDLGQVDLVIYSLASPRRVHPDTGEVFSSTLKPIGKGVIQQGVDTDKNILKEFNISAATEEEISSTVAVMGGDDWQRWIHALNDANVLAPGCKTTAFTYVGEQVTREIYWDGTIGAAKKDLDNTVVSLREKMQTLGGDARVSVLKAVVTQASAAIPVMPLYLGLLFKVMKDEGTHEGCIEQLQRLFTECLYNPNPSMDDTGRLRVDDKEIKPKVQQQVADLWAQITDDNLNQVSDMAAYHADFLRLFGFGIEGVDYDAEVDPHVEIPNLVSTNN